MQKVRGTQMHFLGGKRSISSKVSRIDGQAFNKDLRPAGIGSDGLMHDLRGSGKIVIPPGVSQGCVSVFLERAGRGNGE